MHELSLAQGLIDQLLALADEHRAEKIIAVTVTIGPFSGIVADSFVFGFEALKQEHQPTTGALLVMETPSPQYSCLHCGNIFSGYQKQTPSASPFASATSCPDCGSEHCTAKGGDELILKQLEME